MLKIRFLWATAFSWKEKPGEKNNLLRKLVALQKSRKAKKLGVYQKSRILFFWGNLGVCLSKIQVFLFWQILSLFIIQFGISFFWQSFSFGQSVYQKFRVSFFGHLALSFFLKERKGSFLYFLILYCNYA
ncbi:MAG: hypothetical protein PHD95_05755 [Candidatus ainarchaeum sp.]|nr:hypothetical protein [Candidatus ainarchaeum sp.]